MDDKWFNRIVFWLLCALPLAGLVLMARFEIIGPSWFVFCFFAYAFYYRPFVHINRLMRLGAIEEKEAWKLFVPFYHNRYFKKLWFG